jgi:hypothetical protein
MTRGLKKRISLCCDSTKMPLLIGCDSPYYYKKIKRKYKKQKSQHKRYFKRRRGKYYKQKGYIPKKPSYRRKQGNKNPKECKCYYCHETGHYANKCPKKFNRNKKKFEIDKDIEEMIEQGDFVQLNTLEEIDSDESLFVLTNTDYSTDCSTSE